jgi:protein TonB
MTGKKIRPVLLVTLALQQFCSPVFAQNLMPQQSEVTSSKALPTVKKTIKNPVKKRIIPALKNTQSEQTITTQPLPKPAVAEAPIYPPLPEPVVEAPPPAPLPKIISGVEYLKAPEPEYPPLSKRMGEEGRVILRVLVNEKGHPDQVNVQQTSGSSRLDDEARQAILRSQFKPHIEDGKAIAVYTIIPITFHLDN